MGNEYRFVIVDETGRFSGETVRTSPASVIQDSVGTGADRAEPLAAILPVPDDSFASDFGAGLARRAGTQLTQVALSPLNSATGGLATPTFTLGKAIVTGAGEAAIGGAAVSVAIAAVRFAVDKIQERIAKMEAQAAEAGARDNLLIRAGMVANATVYTGNIWGVRKASRG